MEAQVGWLFGTVPSRAVIVAMLVDQVQACPQVVDRGTPNRIEVFVARALETLGGRLGVHLSIGACLDHTTIGSRDEANG